MVDEKLALRKKRMTMSGDGFFTVTIRKRPWWFWALSGVWSLLEVVLLQTALASLREGENRAATICWIAVVAMGIFGCAAWLRQARPHEARRAKAAGASEFDHVAEHNSPIA
jgi:hypothetical protein